MPHPKDQTHKITAFVDQDTYDFYIDIVRDYATSNADWLEEHGSDSDHQAYGWGAVLAAIATFGKMELVEDPEEETKDDTVT